MRAEPGVHEVLLDPVAYFRPWEKRARLLSPSMRAAVNHSLIEQWDLLPYSEPEPGQAALSRRMLCRWTTLASSAYLIACAKWRLQLAASRLYLDQPPMVRVFMQLGFEPLGAQSLPIGALSRMSLLEWGGNYLSSVAQGTPGWLSSRLKLKFAGLAPLLPPRSDVDIDMNCFWSALDYAACDPRLSQYIGN